MKINDINMLDFIGCHAGSSLLKGEHAGSVPFFLTDLFLWSLEIYKICRALDRGRFCDQLFSYSTLQMSPTRKCICFSAEDEEDSSSFLLRLFAANPNGGRCIFRPSHSLLLRSMFGAHGRRPDSSQWLRSWIGYEAEGLLVRRLQKDAPQQRVRQLLSQLQACEAKELWEATPKASCFCRFRSLHSLRLFTPAAPARRTFPFLILSLTMCSYGHHYHY